MGIVRKTLWRAFSSTFSNEEELSLSRNLLNRRRER